MTNALNQTVSFQYNNQRQVSRITRPEGDYTAFSFDARGNVTRTESVGKDGIIANALVTTATYPATCTTIVSCNLPTSTRDDRGSQTDYQWNGTHGGLEVVTLPAPTTGAVRPQQRFSYAPFAAYYRNTATTYAASSTSVFLPTAVSSCNTTASCVGTGDETRMTVAYGAPGAPNNLQATQTTAASGNGAISSTTAMTYDHKGDVLTVDGPIGSAADTTRFFYNTSRWPIGAIGPDPDGGGPLLNRATRVTYNPDGTVAQQESGTTVGQTSITGGAFTSLQQQTLTYDSFLRPLSARFVAAGTTYSLIQTSYDAAGRTDCVVQRMNPAAFGSPAAACSLGTAGPFGPDRIVQTAYDVLSRPIAVIRAKGTDAEATETSTYTANGRPLTLVDGNGNRSTFAYDGFDRLTRLYYPTASNGAVSNPTDYQEYSYDPNGNAVTYRTRNNQLFTTTYDALNRPTVVMSPANVGNFSYTYDLAGRTRTASVSAVASPASPASTSTMTWDALGRQLTETKTWGGSSLGTSTMAYDTAGRRTSLTLPDGFTTTYTYDFTSAPTQILQGGSPYATYSYDNLGRRAGITRPNGVNTSYGYDPASRLTSLAHAFPSSANNLTLAYTYNPAGQVLSVTPTNADYSYPTPSFGPTNYVVNGLNQSGVDFVMTHDLKGNTLGDGSRVYTYDQANRLRSSTAGSTVGTLSYDGLGRLGELVGTQGARYVYDGVEISGITAAGGTSLINRIVRGPWPDEVVVSYPTASTPLWLIQDHLGSTIGITDPSGNLISSLAYDEYGQPRSGNSGRFQYTGQLWMPDFGAYHYKARAYHPGLGRFLQTDPIGYAAGMNLYGYVGGDPVNWTDPLGLCPDASNPSCTTQLEQIDVTAALCARNAYCIRGSDQIQSFIQTWSVQLPDIVVIGYPEVIQTARDYINPAILNFRKNNCITSRLELVAGGVVEGKIGSRLRTH